GGRPAVRRLVAGGRDDVGARASGAAAAVAGDPPRRPDDRRAGRPRAARHDRAALPPSAPAGRGRLAADHGARTVRRSRRTGGAAPRRPRGHPPLTHEGGKMIRRLARYSTPLVLLGMALTFGEYLHGFDALALAGMVRSEEHTSELQSR